MQKMVNDQWSMVKRTATSCEIALMAELSK